MTNHTLFKFTCIIVLILTNRLTYAANFEIFPVSGILPTSILRGETTTAYYIVKNNAPIPQKSFHVRYLPPNVKQILKADIYHPRLTCSDSFSLTAQDKDYSFCILQLAITGPIDSNDPNPTHHLMLCQDESNCSGVSDINDELNIIEGQTNLLRRVAVVNEYVNKSSSITNPVAYISSNGGFTWSPHNITNANTYVKAVTCKGKNNQSCVALGFSFGHPGNVSILYSYTSADGGLSWDEHVIEQVGPVNGLEAITCNGNNGEYCVAVGGYETPTQGPVKPVAYISADGGAHWIHHILTPPKDGMTTTWLRGVSCSNTGMHCTAIGESHYGFENGHSVIQLVSYASNDGGNTWTMHLMDINNGENYLHAVSCSSDTGQYCIAVGGTADDQPIIYRSANWGADWTPYRPQILKGETGGILKAISCNGNDNQFCMAVGSIWHRYQNGAYTLTSKDPIAYSSIDGGISWTIPDETGFMHCNNTPNNQEFDSVTCNNNGKYCTALGYGGRGYREGRITVGPTIGIINRDIDFNDKKFNNNTTVHWSAGRYPGFMFDSALKKPLIDYGIGITGGSG